MTEEEIDEEIVKEVKDKAGDYRKLKYYQVGLGFHCVDHFKKKLPGRLDYWI